jgi:rod shape-determining protein MreB
MAIDLGTANTLVYVGGQGIVVSEPSVVAADTETGAVHAVGSEAQRMIGRTPATIAATRPLRHGVIADFEVTEQMLRYFIRRVLDRRMAHPRLIVCAPSGITEVEKRAVEEASLAAGARRVHLIEEPIAAAIGAGLEIEEPVGRMVVDVGGGTSEMAVISLGGIVVAHSIRVGGYEMDEGIAHYLRAVHQLAIGSQTAEKIKLTIASVLPNGNEPEMQVRGRHLVSGLPTSIAISAAEVRSAVMPAVREIIQGHAGADAARAVLRHRPGRDPAGRWRHDAPGIRRPGGRRDGDARALGRVPVDLRGLGLGPGPSPPRHARSLQPTAVLRRFRRLAHGVGAAGASAAPRRARRRPAGSGTHRPARGSAGSRR